MLGSVQTKKSQTGRTRQALGSSVQLDFSSCWARGSSDKLEAIATVIHDPWRSSPSAVDHDPSCSQIIAQVI
uniref:Uncharacterized protein n=1 Tax=Oryza glumipatula TaxID=40148 RepID=A0A0D9Y9U4_9ORYZ